MVQKGKIGFIEFIRGTAALMVMLEHLWPFARDLLHYDSKLFDVLTKDFFNIGQMGVVSFFLITGYLVPWSCYGKSNKEFAVSRIVRIYPVYIVSVLGLSIAASALGRGYSITEILINLTLLQMFFGIGNVNGASWVLPYNIIIYILCIIFKKYVKETKVVLGGVLPAVHRHIVRGVCPQQAAGETAGWNNAAVCCGIAWAYTASAP